MGIKRLMFNIGWNYKAEMLRKLDPSKSIGILGRENKRSWLY